MTRPLKAFERPCGYGCSEPWRPWVGSKLIGHAKCALSPEGQEDVLVLMEQFPKAGQVRVARDLGVTIGILRAWLAAALKRRAVRRAA